MQQKSEEVKEPAHSGSKLIGTLENFVPSADFDDYMERAENFFELNNITDDVFKRKLIVHFIGLPALKKLQQLLYPKTHKDVTYETVIQKLKSYFSPKKNRIAQSVEFFKRNQKDYEKVADFAVELQALSKHCVFGEFLDKALRDKFIAGLQSAKIQGELMNCADETSFDEAVSKGKNLEQIEADMAKMKEKQEYTNRINAGNYHRGSRSKSRGREQRTRDQSESRGRSKSRRRRQRGKQVRCYNCSKMGHMARNCWFKRKMNAVSSDEEDDNNMADLNHGIDINHVVNVPLYKTL
ncbi:uncharacterized protein LOC128745803 [Sabethes cyaneus]|uniref:uncharacterized protein LOC128745803 n=1 Tax=Sabethes cyaneus TaxID=53552 RepID=UPI00237DCA2F|nr:uncharacterized protein LOC128745803 [Sabethes cyaneus]